MAEFVAARKRTSMLLGARADAQLRRARIFECFVRGRTSGETRVRGSGIGLSLVQHIADPGAGSSRVIRPGSP